jgi:transposase
MPGKRISYSKVSRLTHLYALSGLNKSEISKLLNITRGTVRQYINYYEQSDLTYKDILLLRDKELVDLVYPGNVNLNTRDKCQRLSECFPDFHERLQIQDCNLKQLWQEYCKKEPQGYKYSHFVAKYHEWRSNNNLPLVKPNKWKIEHIESNDLELLNKWRSSTDRGKWEKAVAILGLHEGLPITIIARKVERSIKTIKKWRNAFLTKGIEHIDLRRTRRVSDNVKSAMERKSEQLIRILHEPPSIHNVNRASWSLHTLCQAYKRQYGERISMSTASEYIRAKGYSFKKAKVALTSPDPKYREKLNKIKHILRNLSEKEKFFSIDEFGPVSIRVRGGRSYVKRGRLNVVPQYQKSKGSLICTAALELATNQITHFYSEKKNTEEMIKLLDILIEKYKSEERIYFSWDAASWHASKKLKKKVDEVNSPDYRKAHSTPLVELAPLPASAQFLNIIESVFSGRARAVIHNSDYQSVDECKEAIDLYFEERNRAYTENPKRAGKKIWGEEMVKPLFNDSNICKDPSYR